MYGAYASSGAYYHRLMSKKSTLQLRKLPPDLLGRINAYIELLGVDREDFFRDLLDDLTKELKSVQVKLRKDYETKKVGDYKK